MIVRYHLLFAKLLKDIANSFLKNPETIRKYEKSK